MADIQFDELPAAGALTGTEVVPGMQSGSDVRMTSQAIANLFSLTASALAALFHAATGKTTPVDADELAIADSAASFGLKKLTWANLKAAVKVPVIQAVTSAGTVTPAFGEDLIKVTAQAASLALANPSGTAIAGWGFVIRIKDNGTSRALTYGTQYRAVGVTLPTSTTISKTLYLGCIWNADDTKLDVVAVGLEA